MQDKLVKKSNGVICCPMVVLRGVLKYNVSLKRIRVPFKKGGGNRKPL